MHEIPRSSCVKCAKDFLHYPSDACPARHASVKGPGDLIKGQKTRISDLLGIRKL